MFLLAALALTLPISAAIEEGAAVSGGRCVSTASGGASAIVAASVGATRDVATATPKQGDVFTIVLTVGAMPQPCATNLIVRPGFKLPEGIELVPPGGFNDPITRCFMGVGPNLAPHGCATTPTEQLADGTVMFDHPNGLWQIPDGQQLRIAVPVRGHVAQTAALQGFVDFVSFDGFAEPLRPTVATQVFFHAPTIDAPTPAVTDVSANGAHVFGFVDPHFNAGTLRLELSEAGGPFVVAEEAELDASQFEANVDVVVGGLAPQTAYEARWTYEVHQNGVVVTGPASAFTTLPAPAAPPADDDVTDSESTEDEPSEDGERDADHERPAPARDGATDSREEEHEGDAIRVNGPVRVEGGCAAFVPAGAPLSSVLVVLAALMRRRRR